MTVKIIGTGYLATLLQACEQNSRPAPLWKIRIQPGMKLLVAVLCLRLGLRLIGDGGLVISLVGFALLIRFPCYCFFAWRDYRLMRETLLRRLGLGSTADGCPPNGPVDYGCAA